MKTILRRLAGRAEGDVSGAEIRVFGNDRTPGRIDPEGIGIAFGKEFDS